MKSEDIYTTKVDETEQGLFARTEEMHTAMLEAGKRASQIPVEYQVEEVISHNFGGIFHRNNWLVIR